MSSHIGRYLLKAKKNNVFPSHNRNFVVSTIKRVRDCSAIMGFTFLPTSERCVYTPQHGVLEMLIITVLQVAYWQSRKLLWDWSYLVMATTPARSEGVWAVPASSGAQLWFLSGDYWEFASQSWCDFLVSVFCLIAKWQVGLMDPVPLQSVNDL